MSNSKTTYLEQIQNIIVTYKKKHLLAMLGLGFAAGLPFLLVFGTLSTWLTEAGVTRTDIGMLSWVGFAYAFKFLWSPILDHVKIPYLTKKLGKRRSWMIFSQAIVILGLIGTAFSNPSVSLIPVVLFALLTAFAGATQDIAVDAWRIEAAPVSDQGNMAAIYQLGYRIAIFASGAGALVIADFVNWPSAYLSMAALMGLGIVISIWAPIPPDETKAAQTDLRPWTTRLYAAIVEPFLDFTKRYKWTAALILSLIGTYRIPDFVMGVMARPFYIDVGFTKTEIGLITGGYGVFATIIGALIGGILVSRIGLMRTLLVGALAGSASNLIYVWLHFQGPELWALGLCITGENLAGGIAGTALIAYMSSLINVTFTATQYAMLSSFYALPAKFFGGFSGMMVDKWGYPIFFTITALIGVPAIILTLIASKYGGIIEAKDKA